MPVELTFEWDIKKIYCKLDHAGQKNIIWTVEWICKANSPEISDLGDSAQIVGTCHLPLQRLTSETPDLIPYEEVTKDQLLDWCFKSAEFKDNIERSLHSKCVNLIIPTIIQPDLWATPALPWSN